MYKQMIMKCGLMILAVGLMLTGYGGQCQKDKDDDIITGSSVSGNWAQVAGGWDHTIALKTDGTLWTWGYNSSNNPTRIGAETNWSAVAGGGGHTIALKTDGTLWAWGDNWDGQLGAYRATPTRIGSDANWSAVATGERHTIARKTNGTLWAWGYNGYGQLGDGTTTDRYTPTWIGTDTNWSDIACGWRHTIAISTTGTAHTLWAWGYNGDGQLGDGTTTDIHTPTRIGTDTNWSAIVAGGYHSLAISTTGTAHTLWAWGYNWEGMLGDGTNIYRTTPTRIGSDANWSAVAGGGFRTLAISTTGTACTLWAWGRNWDGGLGDGTTITRYTPTQIGADTNWSGVAGGGWHSIARKIDRTLWAWGYNWYGQLGDGTTTDRDTPTPVR